MSTTAPSVPLATEHFLGAQSHVASAIVELTALEQKYKNADLPADIKTARLRAVASKIDALRAVRLDPEAHPWAGDLLP